MMLSRLLGKGLDAGLWPEAVNELDQQIANTEQVFAKKRAPRQCPHQPHKIVSFYIRSYHM